MIQPSTLVQKTIAQAIYHYTLLQKEGFPPGVKCWCGAMLEFTYHEPGQKKRRDAFREEHDACEYEEVRADTDQSLTCDDLVHALNRISHPTEIKEVPLSFDPDDYPLVQEVNSDQP